MRDDRLIKSRIHALRTVDREAGGIMKKRSHSTNMD